MTEKANAIMLNLKGLFDPKRRDQALAEFNQSTLDDVGPVGGEQGMAVLKDMNDFEAGHYASLKSLAPGGDI